MTEDIRFALRSLGRRRRFATIVLVVLAVVIAANTTIFSLVEAVLLRPLPYPEPDRLVRVWQRNGELARQFGLPMFERFGHAWPGLREVEQQVDAFEAIGAYRTFAPVTTNRSGHPRSIVAEQVTPGFFEVLGVPAATGRTLTAADAQADLRVAVLGYGYWRRAFDGDPEVLEQTIQLDGLPHQIIGVMPEGFGLSESISGVTAPSSALWTLLPRSEQAVPRDQRTLQVIARLAPGRGEPEARAQLAALATAQAQIDPATSQGWSYRVLDLQSAQVSHARPLLWTLLAAALFILAAACANLANLILADLTRRRHDFSVRAALGADRPRLARQLITEAVLLAVAGALLGLTLASSALDALTPMLGGRLPRLDEVAIRPVVVVFAIGLSLAACAAFYLLPAWRALRPRQLLGRQGAPADRSSRLQEALVILQSALAFLLLASAMWFVSGLERALATDVGFARERLAIASPSLPAERYEATEAAAFFDDWLARLRTLPEITSVAAVSEPPLSGGATSGGIVVEGVDREVGQEPIAVIRVITPGYFDTLGLPLHEGRAFTEHDRSLGQPVAMVNRRAAATLWPDGKALGRRVRSGTAGPWLTVTGVVSDAREVALARSPEPTLYVPFAQAPRSSMAAVVRTADPTAALAAARREAWALDERVPVQAMTVTDMVDRTLATPRLQTVVVTAFAGQAVILAVIGLYGVLAHFGRRRTREIGVRMAIGASAGSILGLVLKRGLLLVGGGLLLGLVGVFASSRIVSRSMQGFEGNPGSAMAITATAILILGLVAVAVPARRAAHIDAAQALREETP